MALGPKHVLITSATVFMYLHEDNASDDEFQHVSDLRSSDV